MTTNEIDRLRRRIRDEFGGADLGVPATRLVPHPSGFILTMRHAGRRIILTREADLDRHLEWLRA